MCMPYRGKVKALQEQLRRQQALLANPVIGKLADSGGKIRAAIADISSQLEQLGAPLSNQEQTSTH